MTNTNKELNKTSKNKKQEEITNYSTKYFSIRKSIGRKFTLRNKKIHLIFINLIPAKALLNRSAFLMPTIGGEENGRFKFAIHSIRIKRKK